MTKPPPAPQGKAPGQKAPAKKSATTPANQEAGVRRTRRNPFIPPSDHDQGPAVSRELLSRGRAATAQLSRNRKVAGDLPDWDPLPPGEIILARPTGSRPQ
jgi:hypothetical protein